MKKLIFKICLIITLSISSASFAQGFSKKSLLTDLNNMNGVSLNANEKSNYEKANNDLVSGLVDLDKKNLSKDQRDKEVDRLFDKRDKTLKSSLSPNKNSVLNKNIKQTKRKVKLAKLVI